MSLIGFKQYVCVSGCLRGVIVAAASEGPAADPVSASGIAKQFLEVSVILVTFPKCQSLTEKCLVPRCVLERAAKSGPFRLPQLSEWVAAKHEAIDTQRGG